ncbi:alpha-glucosidase [Blautia obeum]|uniref:alpha-glucosidase n=1 Tax=Blautia obeum TaxID=40520 RepID=UPI00356143DE
MKRIWWKEAVGYQIYPKSFKDTNGDGIGDIKGIVEKLPYLKELGIDFIWICPFYPSPMKDNGYDVADYYGIDPCFGTMEDMELLLKKAGESGIRVIIDMVLNHSSDQHKWFQEALKDPNSKYRDYYMFVQSKERPSNTRSCFGGSVWENVGEDTWYYHTFDKSQPDLNWENPQLREEVYNILNFWIEKGVSGFRFDAITYIKKADSLKSHEPDNTDGLIGVEKTGQNQEGIREFLQEMNHKCLRNPEIMTVAEAPGVPYENLSEFIGEDGYFSMVFDFSYADIDLLPGSNWYDQAPWTFGDLKKLLFRSQCSVQTQGWGAIYLENHDQSRSLNKYFREKAAAKDDLHLRFLQGSALAALLMGLRGTVFIYQGEELGSVNGTFNSIEEYDDLNTRDQYQRALRAGFDVAQSLKFANDRSRDNSRMPFPWNEEEHGGFTSGTPWLKCNDDYASICAEKQSQDKNSLLYYYRNLIQVRKDEANRECLIYGEVREIENAVESVIAFERIAENGEKIQIWINMSDETQQADIAEGEILCNNYSETSQKSLNPYQAVMVRRR